MKTRICKICKIEKELTIENFKRNVSHGQSRFHYSCKVCDKDSLLLNHWENNKLKCLICENYFEESNFDTNGNNAHRNGKDRRCKKCKSLISKKNRESKKGEDAINRLILERWLGAKDRAEKHNLEFSITKEDIKDKLIYQDNKCAISKIPLTFKIGEGRTLTNISIDRIDSSIGYTKENIQLVCMVINQMKNDLSLKDLIYFCKNIIENYES